MFVPANVREALWALLAFNHEIAKTRDVVSDAALGAIRLKWWEDEIAKIYEEKEPAPHEVLTPLMGVIREYALPRDAFDQLIEARSFDLEETLPCNLEGLLNYVDFTTTPLLRLVVKIMGDDPDIELVQPVAMNYALSGVLRTIPYHTRAGRCFLPEDLLKKHGVSREKPFSPALVEEIATAQVTGLRPDNTFLRASDGLARQYFKQLRRLNYDVTAPRMALDPPFKALHLIFSMTMGAKFM